MEAVRLHISEKAVKKRYGQYFTPESVAEFMIELANIDKQGKILEPASGKGVFLKLLLEKDYRNLTAFELDTDLILPEHRSIVRNESFVSASVKSKFDLIIGNPPYVRWRNLDKELKKELLNNYLWKKYFNSLCDYSYIFILKSVELLKENGQLIFITPEYWLNTTHSQGLRNYLVENGYFEEIYHFNETPVFENVTLSTIIFKFVKTKRRKPLIRLTKYYARKKLTQSILRDLKEQKENSFVQYLEIEQFKKNESWLLTSRKVKNKILAFESKCKAKFSPNALLFSHTTYTKLGDICEIGNGLVSGLDKAFRLEEKQKLNENEKKHVLKVVKAKDLQPYYYNNITDYIFLNDIDEEETLENDFPNFYRKLLPFKHKLQKRYQYQQKIPYWKWVFLRNFKLFNSDKERIFVPCKERISHKNYFRFAYADKHLFPTQDVTAIFKKENIKESIFYILAFLNNPRVFQWLVHKGIVKGNIVEFSERPLASIPFRKIDWDNPEEVEIHRKIETLTQNVIQEKSRKNVTEINKLFDKLLT